MLIYFIYIHKYICIITGVGIVNLLILHKSCSKAEFERNGVQFPNALCHLVIVQLNSMNSNYAPTQKRYFILHSAYVSTYTYSICTSYGWPESYITSCFIGTSLVY